MDDATEPQEEPSLDDGESVNAGVVPSTVTAPKVKAAFGGIVDLRVVVLQMMTTSTMMSSVGIKTLSFRGLFSVCSRYGEGKSCSTYQPTLYCTALSGLMAP
eukprot:32590-Eustigmatos_ZCMA.PRE.1